MISAPSAWLRVAAPWDEGGLMPAPWSQDPCVNAMRRAVVLIRYTEAGRKFHSVDALKDARRWAAFRVARVVRPLSELLLWIYMAAYLFEEPSWCWLRDDGCGDSSMIPRSQLSGHLSQENLRICHIICLAFFIGEEIATSFALNKLALWTRLSLLACSFALLDNIVAFFNGYGLPPREIYWSPVLRPFVFLTLSKSVQSFMRDALPAALSARVIDLALMQLGLMLLWAWCGLLLFAHSPEGDAYFPDFERACRSLFTAFTTANFPDVMMLAYSKNRYVCIYFVIFLVLSINMFFNVLLAALFSAYKKRVRLTHAREEARVRVALDAVFDILIELDNESEGEVQPQGMPREWARLRGITQQTWCQFWQCYCRQASMEWNQDRAAKIFAQLMRDDSDRLKVSAWHQVGKLIVHPDVVVEWAKPRMVDEKCLQRLQLVASITDCAILASLAASAWQTRCFMGSGSYPWLSDWRFVSVHYVCLSCYFVEMGARLWMQRFTVFRSWRHCMDLVLAVSLISLQITLFFAHRQHLPWARHGGGGRRLLALLRLGQAERLLWRFRRLRKALQTLFMLLGTFRKVGSALFLTFFLYSTVGVQIFGGRVRMDSARLHDTDFATAGQVGYYANNFNDFASGLVVLFELMVVNNWFVIAEGLAAIAPGSPRIGWAFCISFYVCIHVILLNVLVTCVVESYDRTDPEQYDKVVGGNMHSMKVKSEYSLLFEDDDADESIHVDQDVGEKTSKASVEEEVDVKTLRNLLEGQAAHEDSEPRGV